MPTNKKLSQNSSGGGRLIVNLDASGGADAPKTDETRRIANESFECLTTCGKRSSRWWTSMTLFWLLESSVPKFWLCQEMRMVMLVLIGSAKACSCSRQRRYCDGIVSWYVVSGFSETDHLWADRVLPRIWKL